MPRFAAGEHMAAPFSYCRLRHNISTTEERGVDLHDRSHRSGQNHRINYTKSSDFVEVCVLKKKELI